MRGGAQMKEALGFVTLLWNHPVLTGLLLLIFTPPFFPLVVYFSPLLMSTALCVVALVSVGSQMEKIKAEGGPGQLENHLGREHGVSRWAPRDGHTRPGNESLAHHYGPRGGQNNHRNNLYAGSGISINVGPAPPSWSGAPQVTTTRATVQLRPAPVESHDPPTPASTESDEDWWDTWVKEYESRPGWGEQDSDQPFRTPAIPTSQQAPTPATIPTPTPAPSMPPLKPPKPEIRDENRLTAPVAAPIPAPVASPVTAPVAAPIADPIAAPVAASVAQAPVSVSVVNRQEASRSLPPSPTTSTSRSPAEVVVSVKVSDYQPHISTLAPIRTGRESNNKRDVQRQAVTDRIGKTTQEILSQRDRGSTVPPPASLPKNVALENPGGRMGLRMASAVEAPAGKGVAVQASEKNRNKIATPVAPPELDSIAGETPLLRHLKTSRSESKHSSRNPCSNAYSPLPVRSSKGVMSEKVLPPPQFSPRLLQSLQPLPPKGLSPCPLPNSSAVPLGNPVEKIPQWVYDGIPKEGMGKGMQAETVTTEEKHVRAFEQAVKVLSYTRRRTHARRQGTPQEDVTAGLSTPSIPSLLAGEKASLSPAQQTRGSSPSSPPRRRASRVVTELFPSARLSDDSSAGAHGAGERAHGNYSASADSSGRASVVTSPTELNTASSSSSTTTPFSPRTSLSVAAVAASLHGTMVAAGSSSPRVPPSSLSHAPVASPPKSALTVVTAASPQHLASRASSSSRSASIASPPVRAPIIAASPRRASGVLSPSIGSTSWPASVASNSPTVGSSPWLAAASVASSPQKATAPIAASPRMVASSPHRSSSPSMPHRRRRWHSSKHGTDKVALGSPSLQMRIEGSTYYDAPAEKEKLLVVTEPADEGCVPVEKEVKFLPSVEVVKDSNCVPEAELLYPEEEGAEFPRWGRSSYNNNSSSSRRVSSNSRRRLEPRRVVTSQDTDMFCRKKSLSTRNGQTTVDYSSSTTDDERESVASVTSVTPRASSRRSMGRTIKPLVWRSRSLQAHEESD